MWNHTVFVLRGQHLILFCGRWEGRQRFTVVRAQEGIHGQESLCDRHHTYFMLMEYSHRTASGSAGCVAMTTLLRAHLCAPGREGLWVSPELANALLGYWATIHILKPFTSSQLLLPTPGLSLPSTPVTTALPGSGLLAC